ncbi:MAG TPA: TraB/GumN family protein [Chitinophagaceae bacterium]|nr:TraB/GumN family protein [Chitinophagaceae bacterium]
MKIFSLGLLCSLVAFSGLTGFTQSSQKQSEKSLLWQISGNGMEKPSFLYGTIHMLCEEDAVLSDSLIYAIENTEKVYLEADLDNLFELFGAMNQMKMRNDTTLKDLLTAVEYTQVKEYIESKNSLLPFSVLETLKPLLVSSTLLESGLSCGTAVAMEQIIMKEAKRRGKRIEGLETMSYQLSIFDSIPYKVQATQLVKYTSSSGEMSGADKEFTEMMDAYKEQDLEKLDAIIRKPESGLENYEDILLFNRNINWVKKLKIILQERSVTIAVGAGHLSGEKGLIELLRKEGYKVKPVKNKVNKKNVI